LSEEWDGLLPIDKPAGPTSHDIVASVRASTGARVGHTGTLDPPATGLLLLVLGAATRLARFLPDTPKTYEGSLSLGVTTTTDDLAGEPVRHHQGALPGAEAVLAAAASLLGVQSQVPPAFSARQVGGMRLYRLARRGVVVDAPASEVSVERFELTPTDRKDRWTYLMVVSAGTYVRAIVRDLGSALGCGAAVASLRRTAIGPLHVRSAVILPRDRSSWREIIRSRIVSLDTMPLHLASIALASAGDAIRFAAGGVVPAVVPQNQDATLVAVRDDGGRLLGVGLASQGTVRPRVVLSGRM
jgi:tRNA pseudouridine55 synthase